MNLPSPSPESTPGGRIALAIAAGIVGAGVFAPGGTFWAFGSVGRLGVPFAVGVVLLLAVAFLLPADRRPGWPVRPGPAVAAAVAALGFGVLASLARVSTWLLGDGQLIVRNFELARSGSTDVVVHGFGSILGHEPVSPLASMLHLVAMRIGEALGVSGAGPALAAESILLGSVLAGLLAFLLARDTIDPALRGWLAILVLLSPTILLYFGYVENYTAAHLVLGIYALLAFGAVNGRVHPAVATGVLLVATGLHVQGLVWWPSAAFLWVARPDRSRPAAVRHLPWILTAAALGAALAAAQWGPRGILLPHAAASGLDLWSARHLADVLQTLWLVCPWLPFVGWLWWRRRGATNTPEARSRAGLADLLVGPALVYVFVLDPVLGAARDWDRAAFLSWAMTAQVLVSLHALRHAGQADDATLRRWLVPALAIGIVVTPAWIAVHHSPARSLAWVEDVVAADAHAHEHGFEALTRYHGDREHWAEAGRWAQAAYEASGNPRLATLAAQHLRRAGRTEEARALLERAIALRPEDHRVRYELVRLLGLAGDCARTLELALEGARLHPDEPIYAFFAADCLYRLGRPAEARAWFRRSLAMEGLPPASRQYAEEVLDRIDP